MDLDAFKNARLAAGLSKIDVAEVLGCRRERISQIENWEFFSQGVFLLQYAAATGVDLNALAADALTESQKELVEKLRAQRAAIGPKPR